MIIYDKKKVNQEDNTIILLNKIMICPNIELYCKEDITLIENYEKASNDLTQTWICHHRLEIELNLSAHDLIKQDMYYNRPANELIFLTRSEHNSLHFKNLRRKPQSEETKKKISDKLKGCIGPNKGRKFSNETKQKISESLKGRKLNDSHREKIGIASKNRIHKPFSKETRQKISESLKGRKLPKEQIEKMKLKVVSNETKRKISESLKGRIISEETKKKISESKKQISEETKEKLRIAAKKQWEKYHKIVNEKNK